MSYPYEAPNRGRSLFLFFIFIFIVLIVVVIFFGDKIGFVKDMKNKISSVDLKGMVTESNQGLQLIVPPSENEWCKVQELSIEENIDKPARSRIIGWDTQNNACVIEYSGYNNCLNRTSIVRYGYTGIIGGKIVWLMIDGFYTTETNNYKDFVNDLGKTEIDDYYCNIEKYTMGMRG